MYTHVGRDTPINRIGVCPACGRWIPPEELEVKPGPGIGHPRRDDPVSVVLARPHRLLEPLPREQARVPRGES